MSNPRDLPYSSLGELLARPFQNGAYYPAESYCEEGGVEMVHMSDAFGGMVGRGGLKRVRCSDADVERYRLSTEDLLVARRSLNYKGSVKPCLIPPSAQPLIFESSLIRITPESARVTTDYLYHYLSNEHARERFVFPYVTQATISGINQRNLAKVPVLLPTRAQQDEFSGRLEKVKALRSLYAHGLATLDALFASLQHRAFRGEL